MIYFSQVVVVNAQFGEKIEKRKNSITKWSIPHKNDADYEKEKKD